MIRFALRLGRWGIVGFGTLAFALTLLQTLGFFQIAGHTAAERAAFGRSMTLLAAQFTLLVPPPIRPDTVGGYVDFRAYGALAIVFAIWALASGTASMRGDEERGLVEGVLATGLSRVRLLGARATAFAIGSFAAAAAAGLALAIGAAIGGESFSGTALLEATIVLTALGFSCYSLTVLVSQITSARAAIGAAGILLLALFLINALSRTFDALLAWRWLSPFRYYELSRPLAPGGSFDARATLVLVAIALVARVLATLAFAHRDLGSPLLRLASAPKPAHHDVSRQPAWRIAIVRGLYDQRIGLVLWTAGIAALAAISVNLAKTIVQPLLAIPELRFYFASFVHGDLYASFLGFIWFGIAQLLLAAFAIAQVARWSAEDSDGRLEAVLSAPHRRTAVVLERAAVLAIGAFVIAAVSGVVVGLESYRQSIDLNTVYLIDASLLLVPFTLVFAALGALLASRVPRATVAVLGGFAFAGYFITQLGPLFQWPAWVLDLSVFKLYGTPLTDGIDQTGLTIMLLVVVAGFAASALAMQRREVGA